MPWYTDDSFKDPNTDLADGNRLVTWSGNGAPYATPLVHSALGEQRLDFDLGHLAFHTSEPLTDCEHPAFNPDGSRVLCTQHQPWEATGSAYGWHLLYQFAWDASLSAWTNEGLVFEPPNDGLLAGYTDSVFPGAGDEAACQNFSYKFAEWCGSDEYVVATLYCSNTGFFDSNDFNVMMSRVVLIKLVKGTTTVDDMWDLTSVVEQEYSATHGSFHGIFSTCSAAAAAAWP